jgi:octaprenyl-diphosphate synthase
LANLFAQVSAEIDKVWHLLEGSWIIKGRKVYTYPLIDFWDRNLIPALVILIAGLYRQRGQKVISLAVMLEYIHLAHRIHNNIKHDPSGPTLWGDYLYARLYELVCSEGNFKLLAPLGKLICSMHLSGAKKTRAAASAEEIIAGERGNLLAEAARLSGLLAAIDSREEALLRNFGFCLGMSWGWEEIRPGSSKKYADQACAYLAQLPAGWQREVLRKTIAALTAESQPGRSLAL